jgi:hypothetical protein
MCRPGPAMQPLVGATVAAMGRNETAPAGVIVAGVARVGRSENGRRQAISVKRPSPAIRRRRAIMSGSFICNRSAVTRPISVVVTSWPGETEDHPECSSQASRRG